MPKDGHNFSADFYNKAAPSIALGASVVKIQCRKINNSKADAIFSLGDGARTSVTQRFKQV